jgi:hypothetical protein
VDVALAVLLEDRYEQFRAAVAAAEAAARRAAAARLWGGGAGEDGAAGLTPGVGAPPPTAHQPSSPLAGLSPEGRAAAVAGRLGGLRAAAGALAVSAWLFGRAASGVGAGAQQQQQQRTALLALPAPAGAVCAPVQPADGGAQHAADAVVVVRPPSAALWRLVAAAAGALRGGRVE